VEVGVISRVFRGTSYTQESRRHHQQLMVILQYLTKTRRTFRCTYYEFSLQIFLYLSGFLIIFLVNFWVHSLSKICEKIIKSSMMQVFKSYLQSFLRSNWICRSVQLEIPISKINICYSKHENEYIA
jgi:hypothetical protein